MCPLSSFTQQQYTAKPDPCGSGNHRITQSVTTLLHQKIPQLCQTCYTGNVLITVCYAMNWQNVLHQLEWDDATRQERALHQRLKERARLYAQPKVDAEAELADALHVVAFMLGDERCALDVRSVRGVRSVEHITRVPSVPIFYRGVVNVRGQIISALDLRAFFGLDGAPLSAREMLIVEAGTMTLAVLTERVEDVMSVPRSEVEPIEMRYALGVTRSRTTILDMEQIAADSRLIVGGKSAV